MNSSTHHGPSAITLERLAPTLNAYEFSFDPAVMDGVKRIYEDVVAPRLDLRSLRISRVTGRLQGGGLSFFVETFGQMLVWVAADDLTTHREFQDVFDRLGLAEAVAPLVEWRERIVMYNGFFVISDGTTEPSWHVDYFDGSNAYTLLTPLYRLEPDHGHLLHNAAGQIGRHEYRHGAGVLVGEGFLHSTEPFPTPRRPRVLLSLTFGTDLMAHWPVLQRTVGSQSAFVVMPCGHQRGTCGCDATQCTD